LRSLVNTDNHGVVTLEGLKSQLLLGLDAHLPQLRDFLGEDGLGGSSRVDTVGLDGNDDTTADLQEEGSYDLLALHKMKGAREKLTIVTDNTGLIGLGNIGKDAVDHADEHAVLEGVTGILDDGDDVCAVGGHVDKVTAGAVGELDGEDGTLGTDNVGNVGNTGTGGGTEVQDLAARAHVDVVDTTKDTGSQLTAEGVPDTVLDGRGSGILSAGRLVGTNADALLAVDALAGRQVLGDEKILLAASDKDTGVAMGLDNSLAAAKLAICDLCRLRGVNVRSATGTTTTTAARSSTTTGGTTTAAATATTVAAKATATAAEATATTATSTAGSETTTTTTVTAAASASAKIVSVVVFLIAQLQKLHEESGAAACARARAPLHPSQAARAAHEESYLGVKAIAECGNALGGLEKGVRKCCRLVQGLAVEVGARKKSSAPLARRAVPRKRPPVR
jgi:hypothetical protein